MLFLLKHFEVVEETCYKSKCYKWRDLGYVYGCQGKMKAAGLRTAVDWY